MPLLATLETLATSTATGSPSPRAAATAVWSSANTAATASPKPAVVSKATKAKAGTATASGVPIVPIVPAEKVAVVVTSSLATSKESATFVLSLFLHNSTEGRNIAIAHHRSSSGGLLRATHVGAITVCPLKEVTLPVPLAGARKKWPLRLPRDLHKRHHPAAAFWPPFVVRPPEKAAAFLLRFGAAEKSAAWILRGRSSGTCRHRLHAKAGDASSINRRARTTAVTSRWL